MDKDEPKQKIGPAEPSRVGAFFRWQLTLLVVMYLGYAAFMLCRNTLISTSPELIQDPNLNLDKESFGHLMSWHSAGAILGKLVTGPGADILGGRRMFLIALSLTAIANIGFAFSSSFFAFAGFNFFGQFAKAGGWPAMTKLVGTWYPQQRYGQVWSLISTSSRVGTITAGLLLGFLLSLISWRAVFVVSAGLTLLVVLVLFFLMKDRPEDIGLESLQDHQRKLGENKKGSGSEPKQAAGESQTHPLDSLNLLRACLFFASSARCWFICFSIVFLTVVMDFLTFIPIYLSESLQMPPSQASMAGSCFPGGMFVALLFTSFVYDHVNKRNLIAVLGGLLMASCLCVMVLWRLDLVPVSIRTPAAIGTIFLLGFTISPAYYIPMSVFSVAYGGKHSGFLVSLIDVFGYSGALLFNFFGGSIAEHYGWNVFLTGLIIITALATFCMVTFLTLDWRAETKQRLATPAS